MQKIKLTVDETAEYMNIIHTDDKLSQLFNTLSELYGSPEWLNEIKPMQDPQTILEEWKEIVREYAADDVINAARRLFRFGKIKTFPMPVHILAELADVEKMPAANDNRKKQSYNFPASLLPIWNKAITFGVVCNVFNTASDDFNAKGNEIRAKLPIEMRLTLSNRVNRAQDEYLRQDPRFLHIYENDPQAVFVACYKEGVFKDIIADIKQNINVRAENLTVGAW